MSYKLFLTNSHYDLGISLASSLDIPTVKCTIKKFANGEINVKIDESIRDDDIIVVATGSQSATYSITDHFFETLLIVSGCKSSSARSITVVMPFLPYCRSDKRDHRGPISAKLVIDQLVAAGATRIVSVDLHSAQIQGFTNIPFDNLYAINVFVDYMKMHLFAGLTQDQINEKYVLVSPDLGGTKRVIKYAEKLQMCLVKMEKVRDYTKMNTVDKCIVIGDTENLRGKVAIVIDDMADTMGTMLENTKTIMESGAIGVIVVVTHGVLSNPAFERINETSGILQVIVADTIPIQTNVSNKIVVVPISGLLSKAIGRIMHGGSLSDLFK